MLGINVNPICLEESRNISNAQKAFSYALDLNNKELGQLLSEYILKKLDGQANICYYSYTDYIFVSPFSSYEFGYYETNFRIFFLEFLLQPKVVKILNDIDIYRSIFNESLASVLFKYARFLIDVEQIAFQGSFQNQLVIKLI